MFCLGSSEDEQDVPGDEFLCFVNGSSLSGDGSQPKHCDVVIGFCSSTEEETRTEHSTPSTVLDVEKAPVALHPLTMEEFLHARRDKKIYQK